VSKIRSIIIGVRISPQFQIVDNAGLIFDKLLKDSKAFPRSVYSKVEYNGLVKTLYEEAKDEIDNYVKISSDNIIYSQNVENDSDIMSMINSVRAKFEDHIVPVTLNEYKATIVRIGTVFVSEVNASELKKFKSKYFARDVEIAEFRFSKSDGLSNGIYVEGGDYSNRIFSYAKKIDGSGSLTFDYQRHFQPLRPNWIDCDPNSFFNSAVTEVKKEIISL